MQPASIEGPVAQREFGSSASTTVEHPQILLGPGDPAPGDSHLPELLEIFARQSVLFLVVLLVLFGGGTAIVLNQKHIYTAEVTVLFDPRTRQVVNFEPVLGQFPMDANTLQTAVESELQLILSRRVIDPVISKYGLSRDPEFNRPRRGLLGTLVAWSRTVALPPRLRSWTDGLLNLLSASATEDDGPEAVRRTVVGNVMRRLSAQVKGHSTAIQISFGSENPRKAAAIANAIAANYVQFSVAEKSAAVQDALATLSRRSAKLRDEVVQAENAVDAYRTAARLVEGSGGSLASMQINEISPQLVQAEADLAAARARLQQTKSVGSNRSAAPEVLASVVVQKLREEEAKQVAALAEIRNRYGDYSPLIAPRQSALTAVREQINAEIANIVRGQQAAVIGAQERVNLLKATLEVVWRNAGENGPAEVHLRQLKLGASVKRALYEAFLRRIQEVSQQVGTAQPYAEVISPAEAPQHPSWPNVMLLLPCLLVVATVLASCCAVVAELFSKGFRSLRQVAQVFGDRPIELIPRFAARRGSLLQRPPGIGLDAGNPFSAYSESVHALRVQLRRSGFHGGTVLFTSAVEGEGKTSTAIAFAQQEAQAGFKVLMIDLDLRRPKLHQIFGGSRAGLSELLGDREKFADLIQYDAASGMAYIAAGKRGLAPVDLLSSAKMQQLLRELERHFDRIIIDSPAVLAVADARILTTLVDRTIYLVRWGRTPRRLALLGLELLQQSGGSMIGPIFVQVDSHVLAHGGYVYVRNYITT